jgi:hypothetical protein
VPNLSITIRNFFIAGGGSEWRVECAHLYGR